MADRARRKRRRLSRSGEFERVYREGRSHASRYLVVYAFPRAEDDGEARLGVSVGRKLGGAVERNRIKRLLREAFWTNAASLRPGHDFVIVVRPHAPLMLADYQRLLSGMAVKLHAAWAKRGEPPAHISA